MKRFAITCIAVAVAALTGLHAAAASTTTFVVDSTGDALDALVGDGRCATSSGMCTLRAAVAEANALPGADTIEVPGGTYEIAIPPLNQNDITTGDLDITDSVTIVGAGASSTIIDGGVPVAGSPVQVHGLDRLFEVLVDGGEVNFRGMTFSDGYAAEYGGAIVNNSTAKVTVAASTFTGNVAGKSGGAIDNHLGGTVDVRDATLTGNFAYENGSALNNNRDGTLTVTRSNVSSNSAADVGLDESLVGAGAISNNAELDLSGTIVVTESVISDNRAGGGRSGATISNDGAGTVAVERTTFSKNIATGNGGAIFNSAGAVSVADSTFSENAAESGGAIFNGVKDGNVTVSGSTFSLNTATGRGGAIASAGSGTLTVLDSTFSKNGADDWGGAILNDDKGTATVRGSTFRENSGLNGGGFANEGSLVTVEDTTFANNTAFAGAVLASGEGGGMHTNSVGEVVITGGAFTENDAHSGGGLSNEGGGTLVVTGTRFSANSAEEKGGGILIQSGAVRMLDIDVIGNVADAALEAGGGIAYEGDKLVSIGESAAIEGSRIRDNKAKGDGGGIDSRGDGPLSITTTAITGNAAAAGGGIHHVGDAPLDVTRSTLSGNFAERGGGLFTDGDGETGVENTTVSNNRAGQFGGGLLVSSRLSIRSSTVANNSAPSGGGINNGGSDLVGDGSVYLANTIVANSPTGGNCVGTMTSLGGNLENADSCQLRELSDQPGTDPRLGPLAANGGPTLTHELLEGSPAQERAVCTELEPCPPVDQRGVARPLFVGVDVGAFESERPPTGGGGGQPCTGRMERPVPADFDSWVSQGAPSANFGSDATLKVESKPSANDRALVHFALPPVPPGCKLVGATLRLYSSSATDGHPLEALRVADDWTELGVTWANQPATAGAAATTESGLGLREWDVLEQALDMYALGNHGFLLRDADENGMGEQSFHSTEKGVDNPPQLVLVFDDPDAPPQPDVCPTTSQSLPADRDSWVSEGSPANNFGSDSTLKVKSQLGYNSRALLRFPLPALPAGCTSIASATLRVEAASAKDGRTLEARRIASDWTEVGVTWSSQPATAGPAATVPSAEGPLEWAVTDQVLEMYTSTNHGFLIRDADENGVGDEQTLHSRDKLNDSPPELVLVFDDSTPETTIGSGPPSPTDSTEASFVFSSDPSDAAFECSLDGAAFRACSSPHTVAALTEGDHALEVRALRKVRALDPTPARYEWTVTVPPETNVAGPASPSATPNAVLAFSSDDPEASFECSLNGAPFAACMSPVEYTGLADGENEVRVRAVDRHGSADPTPATHSWLVAVPPETTISAGPADPTTSTSAGVSFDADEPASFECALDAGDWEPCSSPVGYADLAEGHHTLRIRATDRAGNVDPDPATYTWTVDTTAPTTTIGAFDTASAAFTFSADESATFECALDTGDWTACTSPHSYTSLPDGEHTFQVRATDPAGSTGAPATRTWTVDTVAPTTTIDAAPPALTNDPSPAFEFTADERASFECRLDTGDWAGCSSAHEIAGPLADGDHTFEVRASDAAGNTGAPAAHAWTVDTVAPTTTIDTAPPALSKDPAAAFEFAADERASFECRLDTGAWAVCTSPHELALADGAHTFEVRATDPAGNTGARAAHAWTVDTVAPTTTVDAGPADPTNHTTATFEFTADGRASFECRLDTGDWAGCTSSHRLTLADGAHTLEVRATDDAGNTGTAASYTWTIDTIAPTTTIDAGPADPTNHTTAAFELAADEAAEFQCRLDAGDWTACTAYTDLGDGPHTLEARATDAAGNTGTAAAHTWTIDTIAPTATIDVAPPVRSNDPSPTLEFTAGEPAGFECRLDTGDWARCTSPHEIAGPLADGRHSFEVRATDEAGNTGALAAHAWTVDTVAPTTTIDTAPPAVTNDPSATFEFTADESADFECRLDTGDWAGCTSSHRLTLADGAHTLDVRATDEAGNTGTAASYTWTIDTTEPTTTIDAGPADPTNHTTAAFELAADEAASFECKLDTGDWTACTTYTDLADGPHTLEARATDAAGNTGTAAAHTWTVDTIAPTVTIDAAPRALTNDPSATFELAPDEPATIECRLDTGDWTACTTYTDLADGPHTLEVRATDTAGNTGALATYTWTIDTTSPITTIDPADATSATFAFSANEPARFECKLDTGDWAGCTSPHSYAALADGQHVFQVRATDDAGNTGALAAHTWTLDTGAPVATIVARPPDPTNDASATFALEADEPAGFECKLDSGDWAACTSPQTYAALADGEHTFQARAADTAGNTGAPATYAWTIDTRAPVTTIESADEQAATFAFRADEPVGFECKIDGGEWSGCTSPHRYASLSNGEHTFQVRATDAAGNTGAPATHSWTIDTVAPATTIVSGPADPSDSSSAAFVFTANEPASFECKLDAGDWTACDSPQSYTGLGDGEHAFGVRATDRAGNTGEPTGHRWTIDTTVPDTTAPDTTIADGPSDPSRSASASFRFTGSDDQAPASELRFECRLDSQAFGACSSPKAYSGLADGSHTFEVRAVDLAGNADPTPATHTWTIDSAAPQTRITSAPAATTSSTSASFSFTADEAGSRFECSLDGAAYTACSSPAVYSGLAAGSHQFSVRATDPAGNTEPTPATHTWTISLAPACGQAVTAVASADAWIDENSPTSNKGTDSILKVQSKGPRDNFRAAIRFALPAAPSGCAVQSATLRMYAASYKPGRTLHAFRLASAWTENQVSWMSQLLATGSPAATTSGIGYREWNVTAHVQAMYQGPNHGFLIRDAVEGQDAEQQFHSREKGQNPPQLIVRFGAP